MYSKFLRKFCMPLAERVTEWPVNKYLTQLLESQWWSPSEIEALQNEKLRVLICHVYQNVPYYRQVMDDAKLKPSDIQTTEDLQKLPVITKEIVKKNFPDRIVARNFDRSKLITGFSGGSTGKPFQMYTTREEKGIKWASVFRWWSWAEYDLGVKCIDILRHPHSLLKNNRFLGPFKGNEVTQKIEELIFRRKFLSVIQLSEKYLDVIQQYQPEILLSYPSVLIALARYARQKGLSFSLKSILNTAETLVDVHRKEIEDVFGCKIFNFYGGEGMEFMAECEAHEGYHVNAENVFIELTHKGERVAGKIGEVTVTNLNGFAMPFIRYNIEDAAEPSDGPCSCGRTLPLVKKIHGRMVDMLVLRSNRLLMPALIHEVFEPITSIEGFQIIQERVDLFKLKIVKGQGYGKENEKKILIELKKLLGEEVEIRLEYVDEIARTTAGKRRYSVSKLRPTWN